MLTSDSWLEGKKNLLIVADEGSFRMFFIELILSELEVSMNTGHGEAVLELWLRILIVIIRLTNVRFIKSNSCTPTTRK